MCCLVYSMGCTVTQHDWGKMIGEEQDRESHRHHPSRKQGEGLDMFFRATLIAAAIATAAIGVASPAHSDPPCYIAASGDCVPYPQPGPAPCGKPTAICRDGDYSCSEHPYSGGTCHGHGDVQTHLT
jgi:hypothetical protein